MQSQDARARQQHSEPRWPEQGDQHPRPLSPAPTTAPMSRTTCHSRGCTPRPPNSNTNSSQQDGPTPMSAPSTSTSAKAQKKRGDQKTWPPCPLAAGRTINGRVLDPPVGCRAQGCTYFPLSLRCSPGQGFLVLTSPGIRAEA